LRLAPRCCWGLKCSKSSPRKSFCICRCHPPTHTHIHTHNPTTHPPTHPVTMLARAAHPHVARASGLRFHAIPPTHTHTNPSKSFLDFNRARCYDAPPTSGLNAITADDRRSSPTSPHAPRSRDNILSAPPCTNNPAVHWMRTGIWTPECVGAEPQNGMEPLAEELQRTSRLSQGQHG